MTTTYGVASPGGLTFGFYFFLALTAAMAFMMYVLLTHPSARRPRFAAGAVRRRVAAPLACLLWVVVFTPIYLVSLAGFHAVTVGDTIIEVAYAVPRRSVSLTYAEIGDVIRRPAYRSLWRLEIYTLTGLRLESAPGSYQAIRDAGMDIDRRLRAAAR